MRGLCWTCRTRTLGRNHHVFCNYLLSSVSGSLHVLIMVYYSSLALLFLILICASVRAFVRMVKIYARLSNPEIRGIES